MKFPGKREWLFPCAAAILLALLAALATLQYRWTSQVGQADLERMRSALNTDVARFGRDFDAELARVPQTFSGGLFPSQQSAASEPIDQREQLLGQQWERWLSTASHPALVANLYFLAALPSGGASLSRYDRNQRELVSVSWPAELSALRSPLQRSLSGEPPVARPPSWGGSEDDSTRREGLEATAEETLAFVLPFLQASVSGEAGRPGRLSLAGYSIVQLDRQYLRGPFIEALAQHAFPANTAVSDYDLAVVSRSPPTSVIYTSNPAFQPDLASQVDARIPLFRTRLEARFGPPSREGPSRPGPWPARGGPRREPGDREFGERPRRQPGSGEDGPRFGERGGRMGRDGMWPGPPGGGGARRGPGPEPAREETGPEAGGTLGPGNGPRGLEAESTGPPGERSGPEGDRGEPPGQRPGSSEEGRRRSSEFARAESGPPPSREGRWELVVRHKVGSLEAVVAAARRRNLGVSFGILLLLAGSIVLITLSGRQEQRLVRQQLDFVAGISHELRTPLAVICSAGENLADGVIDSPSHIRDYGALIRSEGRRLTGMVEQILEFAGIRSGKVLYEMRPVNVEQVVGGAREACATQIQEAGVAFESEIEPRLPQVQADQTALIRALQNLFANAIKYGGNSRWIRLCACSAAGPRGPEVQITVQDRGPGIPASDLPHIFEPFYRGRQAIAAQVRGSGLGLNLVKNIVEAHGGTVTVVSAPEMGSSFTIHLPALV